MRKYGLASAAVLCVAAALLFAACRANDGAGAQSMRATSAATPAATASQANSAVPGDGVRRVTTKELQAALADKGALVVDVRDETSYKNGHIKGALSIPLAELPNRLSDLPKDKLIVFYCA